MADALTLSRIAMAGLIWAWPGEPWWIIAWMGAAGISDVLDGWFARRRGGPSRGEWLDPLCDKIFVASLMALLVVNYPVPLWVMALIGAREIVQALMALLLPLGKGFDFKSATIGKAATVVQFVAMLCILFAPDWVIPWAIASAAVGLASVAYYIVRFLRSRAA